LELAQVNFFKKIIFLGPPTPFPKNKGFLASVISTLVKAATSPDRIHDVLTDLIDENHEAKYFRFQPTDSAFACELDETDEAKLAQIQLMTRNYCNDNLELFMKLAEILKNPLTG
jgi:hypothetical protein